MVTNLDRGFTGGPPCINMRNNRKYLQKSGKSCQIALKHQTYQYKKRNTRSLSLSLKLVTLSLEDVFKKLKWENRGLVTKGERMNIQKTKIMQIPSS